MITFPMRGFRFCFISLDWYLHYFNTPYFIFLRDTMSYLIHLGLHFAVCLAPSSISFSRLEWAIWVFYMGRIVMESKQFGDIKVHRVKEEGISLDGSMDLIEVSFEPQGSSRKTSPTSLTTKKFSKYLRYITSDIIILIYAVFK